MTWSQVIGPLLAILSSGGGYEETKADSLRFAGKYVTIDSTRDGVHHLVTVLAKTITKIIPLD
jgi:hypothetical protein